MYPQRRYKIPSDVLKAGKNTFVIRVTNNAGKGGFVPDKPYYIFSGTDTVDLKGYWKYKVSLVFMPSTGGGSWYERPTLQALLGSLMTNEAHVLMARDPALATRLGGLPAPGAEEAFQHHAKVLSAVVGDISSQVGYEARYRHLMTLYHTATLEWPGIQAITGARHGADAWISALYDGLALYGKTEGW